jgi:hypothetical protein
VHDGMCVELADMLSVVRRVGIANRVEKMTKGQSSVPSWHDFYSTFCFAA